MRGQSFGLSFFLLIAAAVITLACGTSRLQGALVQSLVISPASADAQNYPNGQVQFTATAYYETPPSPVKNVQATWGACYQNDPTSDISVSTNGLAHCGPGASGVYTVWAYVIANDRGCPEWVNSCGGGGCQVTGTAQLTCP